MGSMISKSVKPAPKIPPAKVVRKYPARSPPPPPRRPAAERGWLHAESQSETSKSPPPPEPTGADPALAARLQSLGPVSTQPSTSDAIYNLAPRAPLNDPKGTPSPSPSRSQTQTHDHGPAPATQFSHFQPSASNPSQAIFPSRGPDPRQNPAVSLLTARYRLAAEADAEFARTGKAADQGRRFVDVVTLRQVLVLRDKGVSDERIESQLGLGEGVVRSLGRKGVVGVAYD